MEIENQIKLRFHGVDIIKVDFTSSQPIRDNKPELDIAVDAKVFYPKEIPTMFNIWMDVHILAKEFFNITLLALGTFTVNIDSSDDPILKNRFVNINAPAIMFPYIRSFVTTFTASLGNVTGAVIIPTKFFKGELEEIIVENPSEPVDTTLLTNQP
jgi:preprotein translocase subunit SecB